MANNDVFNNSTGKEVIQLTKNTRILIGSTIRQTPEILEKFLESLNEIDKANIITDYFFMDDNVNVDSTNLLQSFQEKTTSSITIEQGESVDEYICTDVTHFWKENLIRKVAEYKNKIIRYCHDNKYDYLFLVDSDLVLHPKTLKQLLDTGKDIISEIYWTKWQNNSVELPQVWLYDQYSLIPKSTFETLTEDESQLRYSDFMEQLRKPGVYKVGGLGACTLISKKALDKGVNFDEVYNVSFWGEDRHFCIRAAVLGFKLYVDTTYPAYHIYRMEYLKGVAEFKAKCKNSSYNSLNETTNIEVVKFAKDFLKTIYSCDYRIITGVEGINYLSPQYTNKLLESQDNIVSYLIERKMICKTNILEIKSDNLKNTDKEIIIQCKLEILRGTKSVIEKTNFSCNLSLKKQLNNEWKIENIELFNCKHKPIFGFSLVDLLEEKIRIDKAKNNKLTLAMLVRNESKKFIKDVLAHAAQYIDNAVILDDASDDDTVDICKAALKNIPLTIVSNMKPGFNNEILLRKQLWQMTIDTNPDWILCLDADEVFEDRIKNTIKLLIDQPNFNYYSFRLYDMWDEVHYREDNYWQAHNYFRPFLVRYQPNFSYEWNNQPLHCGRFPKNITSLSSCLCKIRLKHLGWSTKQLREEKYKRYLKFDPEGKYGIMDQYMSILDEKPVLIPWS